MFLAFSKNNPKRKMLRTTKKLPIFCIGSFFVTQNFQRCGDVFQNLLPQSWLHRPLNIFEKSNRAQDIAQR